MMPIHTVREDDDEDAGAPTEAGDVPNSVLGVGYDDDELARQAELEELAEAELEPLDEAVDVEAVNAEAAAPPLSLRSKLLRTFAFAFAGAFLSALLPVADSIAGGDDIDLSVGGSLLVGALAASLAAGIRALVALAPVLPDDEVGLRRAGAQV
jgi:hypothetical protein